VHWAEFRLGPDAQRGARPVATRAQPTCAALARPTTTWPTASAGRSARGPRARRWPSSASVGRRVRRVAHGARRRKRGAARRDGAGRWHTEATGRRRLTGAETAMGGRGEAAAAARPAAVRATRLGQRRSRRRLSGRRRERGGAVQGTAESTKTTLKTRNELEFYKHNKLPSLRI
jgi:hypothetical protein